MSDDRPADDSGLHVDEGWKNSVAQEKQRLRADEEEEQKRREAAGQPPLPEPSIQVFTAGLYTQTLIALGELEHPATGERTQNLTEAQYLIDTIAMLQQKMAGNLEPDEQTYVQNVLTDLRMRFVSRRSQPAGEADAETASEQG
jgi:hypothetical protein